MNFEFSSNNSLSEFEAIDTANNVYVGFAGEPARNVFSHKYRGSSLGCSTEALLANLGNLQVDEPSELTVTLHLVQGTVSLDVATACFALKTDRQTLASRQWKCLTQYISEVERGFTRPPFLRSLYAFFYATAMHAKSRFPGEDRTQERNENLLEIYHETLQAVLDSDAFANCESLNSFFDIIPDTFFVSAQEEILAHELERYLTLDFERSDQFELDLPLKHREAQRITRYSRVRMLALPDPQSALFKFFARNPMPYPGMDGDQSFPCTYVHNAHNKGRSSEHVISVPPTAHYNLHGLSKLLEEMEDRSREMSEEALRPKDNPRPGYEYDDPWYDERHAEFSILDNPREGSRLSRDDVLEALWFFGSPLRNIKARYVSTSVFIPFWPKDARALRRTGLTTANGWQPWTYEAPHLKDFLPYMEEIFLEAGGEGARLSAFRWCKSLQLQLAPVYVLKEGPAVDVVRGKVLAKSREILQKATIDLRAFVYEYGLGILEIRIDTHDGDLSIFDIQWLEHCATLTPLETLIGQVVGKGELNPMSPHKHYACTSMTALQFEGGNLGDGRSTGGGVQMMVSDVEPIYKNLPLNTSLETQQTVIDETSKRYYYCSPTSLLNFDDVGPLEEHELAHVSSSIVFNMVLAQRFILAEARQDIIRAENQDRMRRQSLSLMRWLGNMFRKNEREEQVDISAVREDIQHLTTSAWFNVVSNTESTQRVFEKLRSQMKIQQFYDEVQDRTKDLDEYIAKKQSDVQNRVFTIFTFIMSPLNLVLGFVGGMGLATFANYDRSVPFLDVEGDITVFLIYFVFWSIIFAVVWMIYKYRSAKE